MKKSHPFRKNRSTGPFHHEKPRSQRSRRPHFERLEDRWLLSAVGFNSLSDVTLAAGTTMFIPLNSTDAGKTVNYAVTASDYSMLTPNITPSTNKTLQLNVLINGVSQPMDFQLFDNLAPNTTAKIEQLVNSGFYNGLEIYRSVAGFVLQGGNDPPDPSNPNQVQPIKTDTSPIAEEFNPDLQYTSAGILAMARQGTPNTSSSEFFITEAATRSLDFNYTMFGLQTTGTSVNTAIEAMANSTTNTEYLATPVTISSASIFTDTQNGVLELRAPTGVTGTVTVTVVASDGTNAPTTHSFTVTIAADTPPTGETYTANPFASVIPAAPTSVAFLPGTGDSSQSTNLNNSTSGKALQFQVSGVTSGNLVEVLADGNVIGQTPATGTTVTVTTDGSTKLTDGSHTFTAIQVAQNQMVTVNESDSSNTTTGTTAEPATANVPSLDSSAISLTVNTTVAGISSTQATGAYRAGTAIPITVTFSGPVTVTGTPQLALNVGSGVVANYTSGSGTSALTFTYTVAAGQNISDLDYTSTTALALNGGTIQNATNNAAVLTLPTIGTDGLATQNIAVDTTAPTVAGVSSTQASGTYGAGTAIPITVTFSEPVTVTGTPQLALNAGSGVVANYTSGSGTSTLTFTYTVAAGDESSDLDYVSTAALALNGGSIQDEAGNAATLTLPTTGTDGLATQNIVIAPAVTGVSSTQATGAYAAGTAIPITVTFSGPVTVTGTPQLALNAGSSAVASYTGGSGTATLTFTYTVAAGDNSSDLDYASTTALAFNGGSIQDAAGNAALLTLPTTSTDGLAAQKIVVDTTAPTVTAVTSTPATVTYGLGRAVPLTVTFSEPVTVTGTPQLALNVGSGVVANYTSGSGTSTLTFTYTVVAGQNISDLDYASTTALALNGGSIQDPAGNAATLTLPTTGTDGLATQNITIDTVGPAVAGVSSTQATGAYGVGTAIPITVMFSAPVTVTGTPQLALNAGSGAVASYTGGSGTSTLTFTYTVAAGQNISGLDYTSITALALDGGSIQDAAGNAAVLTLPITGTDGLATQNIVIDTTAPTVAGVSSTQATGTYGVGTAIPITVTFSEPVTVTGTPQLALNAGSGVVANYTSGSGTSTLTFTYTVAAGDNSSDLDYASTTALALNSGSLQDAAGNAAVLTLPATGTDGLATQNITIDTQTSTASLSGYVYIDAENDGSRITPSGAPCVALPGVVVQLFVQGNGGSWTLQTTTMTAADGSYHFTDLAAGTYQIQETQPVHYLAGEATVGTIGGVTTGTAGQNQIQVDLTEGAAGVNYNFGSQGLVASEISLRMLLASSPSPAQIVTQMDAPPVVSLASSTSGGSYSMTYTTGGSPAAIADASATVTDTDSPMLASMTATISNLLDGAAETLAADTSNTSITAAYANGVLTLSGVADLATYQQVLQTITYSDTAISPTAGDRTINVVANDGIVDGQPAVATVTVVVSSTSSYSITADQSEIDKAEASATSFTFADAAVGATYKYTVTSSGGGTAVTGSGTITTATQQVTGINVSTLSDGTLTYSVTLTDTAGNTGNAVTATATLDQTVPTGYSITADHSSIGAAGATTSSFTFAGAEQGTTYHYTVTSSGGGTPVTGSGTVAVATQQVADIDVSALPDGTLTYSVTLTDAAGNVGTAATATATLDQTAPTVAGVSSTQATGAYGAGTAIPITVTFSEPVTVTGTPQLALNAGSGIVANYASGSGTSALTFTYTVAAGDNSSDLDYASTTALALNGGTIQDAAGNAATLTLPATGSDGLATQNIVIDTTAPTVAGVSSTQATGTYGAGTAIPITVTFSEPVTVTGTPQLALNAGSGVVANYTSGSGTSTLTFTYTVAAGDNSSDLDYSSTTALALNAGTIKDAAGNAATLILPATGGDGLAAQNITINTQATSASSVIQQSQAAVNAAMSQSNDWLSA